MADTNYSAATDSELASLAKSSADAYSELISRYLPSIRRLAGFYTRISADRDDLVSEGILGLMSAVKEYEGGKGAGFSTFAGVCVNNRMMSALKKSANIKKREEPLDEIIAGQGASPEKTVLDREVLNAIFKEISENLTALERAVFTEYLSGASYKSISDSLNIDLKAVDNALSRVRKKLRRKFR